MHPKPPSTKPEPLDEELARSATVGIDEDDGRGSEGGETTTVGESYDDSLEAVLLQAGARPPEASASKLLGSKTLMGTGLEGLNLGALRPKRDGSTTSVGTEGDAATDSPSDIGDTYDTNSGAHDVHAPAETVRLSAEIPNGNPPGTSLLDEVAQALNVQASAYRDRARGRLPGMPVAGKAPFSMKNGGYPLEAEFEDPDDGDTALTPGVISVLEEHAELNDIDLTDDPAPGHRLPGDGEEVVVLSPSGLPGSSKLKDSRPWPVPPPPGLTVGTSAPSVGPPPGLPGRATTPAVGMSPTGSGRMRLQTPLSGSPSVGARIPSGRFSLPQGSAAVGYGNSFADLTSTSPSTPISLEASRRISNDLPAGPGSGRVTARGSAYITQPVVRSESKGLSTSALPDVLAAQVKISTLSLTGLVAVTFAGGLLVGMLVWRGQGRPDATMAMRAPASSGAEAAKGPAPGPPSSPSTAARPAAAPMAAPAVVTDVATATSTSRPGVGTLVNAAPTPTAPVAEAIIVAPIAAPSGSVEAAVEDKSASTQRAAAAIRAPVRVRRVATIPATASPGVAPAGAVVPKPIASRPPGTPPPSKAMANNAGAKPAAKSKAKAAWHDPFAD